MIIQPAVFADVYKMEYPEGFTLIAPEDQFESEEWFSEHALTVITKGRVVGVFGVLPLWRGVGHIFAYVTKDAKRYPKTLIQAGTAILRHGCEKFEFWRLQSTVRSDFERGINYLEYLGFELEGELKKYGPDGADHLMMSRVAQ